MKMQVTIQEAKITEYTYFIEGVNSIEEGQKLAIECYRTHRSNGDCYLGRTIPRPSKAQLGTVKITDYD